MNTGYLLMLLIGLVATISVLVACVYARRGKLPPHGYGAEADDGSRVYGNGVARHKK